jgi:CHAD domain-containing protein
MAPAIETETLRDLAQVAIAKYLKQAVAYEKPVLADTDPEDLHQMRVGLRRLRTALQVFDVAIKLPQAAREPQVAAVARQLGALRDLDVIQETLRTRYLPDLPEHEQVHLAAVLVILHKRRKKVFKGVKKMLKDKPYKHLKKSLKAWGKAPQYKALATLPATYGVPDLLAPLVSQLWLHPGWLVGTAPTDTGPTVETELSIAATDALISSQGAKLHSLRKQVKRVRYQLKVVADMYNGALADDLHRLSEMQTTLGDLQDSTVLEEFVAQAVPQAKGNMPTLFALLADSRHRAWKQWQGHQQYYLAASHRQQLRLAVLNPAGATEEPTTVPDAAAQTVIEISSAPPSKRTTKAQATGKTTQTTTTRRATTKTPRRSARQATPRASKNGAKAPTTER